MVDEWPTGGKKVQKYSSEEVITILRQAEVLQSKGLNQSQICKELGISAPCGTPHELVMGNQFIGLESKLSVVDEINSAVLALAI